MNRFGSTFLFRLFPYIFILLICGCVYISESIPGFPDIRPVSPVSYAYGKLCLDWEKPPVVQSIVNNGFNRILFGAREPIFCKNGEGYMFLSYEDQSYKFPPFSWPIQLTKDRIVYAGKKGNSIVTFDLVSRKIKQFKVKGTVYSLIGENCEYAMCYVDPKLNRYFFYRLPVDSEPVLIGEITSKKFIVPDYTTVREKSLYIINEGLLYKCDENGLNVMLDLSGYLNADPWHTRFGIVDDISNSNDKLILSLTDDVYVIDISSSEAHLNNIYKSIIPVSLNYSLTGKSFVTFDSGTVKWFDLTTGSCKYTVNTPFTYQDVIEILNTCDDHIVLITENAIELVGTDGSIQEFYDLSNLLKNKNFGFYCNEDKLYIAEREYVYEIKSGN